MLKAILEKIEQELENNGVERIYTAFDYISIEKKGKEIFTVVGIDSFESYAPIYSESVIYLSFKAEAAVSLVAPESFTMAELYDYFDGSILPALMNMTNLTCSLRDLTIKNDTNINRLVLKVKFSVTGITRLERSSS